MGALILAVKPDEPELQTFARLLRDQAKGGSLDEAHRHTT
jgi:hypothetical protein